MTFLVANFEACLLYFVALQQGLSEKRQGGRGGGRPQLQLLRSRLRAAWHSPCLR